MQMDIFMACRFLLTFPFTAEVGSALFFLRRVTAIVQYKIVMEINEAKEPAAPAY